MSDKANNRLGILPLSPSILKEKKLMQLLAGYVVFEEIRYEPFERVYKVLCSCDAFDELQEGHVVPRYEFTITALPVLDPIYTMGNLSISKVTKV